VADSGSALVRSCFLQRDKLLATTSGILAGDERLVTRLRREPMFRALLWTSDLSRSKQLCGICYWNVGTKFPCLAYDSQSSAELACRAEAHDRWLDGIRATVCLKEAR